MNVRLLWFRHISADTAVRQDTVCACESSVCAAMGYSERMASENDDSADFDRLARRYLDLWQSQLAGLSADQALTEQIARLFAAANTQVASAIKAAQGAQYAATPPGTEARTPSAAASSGHGADDVGELRKRVEALEARIAELESKLGGA
jgi:predicted alpha-1,6-mannanase (GH76 family)